MENVRITRLLALGLCATAAVAGASSAMAQTAHPSVSHPYAPSQPISGRYIVVFKSSVSHPAAEAELAMRGLGGQLHHVYAHALKGFAATLPAAALPGLRNNPLVDYLEVDQTVALQQTSPENNATWGLDRIDQADRPLSSQYYFNYTGAGVNAFVIDTGVRQDHAEFSGRIKPGYSVVQDSNGTNDCHGHGTHVAGAIGGFTWGVAKGVALIPVRVLDCTGSGSWSGVIAGVDWVAGSTLRPAVANMSLSGGASTSVNAAVAGAVSKGVTMVVAAGNSNADACKYSPAKEPSAITVGATDSGDARASYSNYGTCVDMFAPGSAVTSAWITSATASSTLSGTSMAAPHATGVAALALEANPAASPGAVTSFLTSHATAGRLSAIGTGSKNLLTYSLAAGAPAEAATQTVVVESLSGSARRFGRNWRASVVVTLRNISTGAVVVNASVNGSFSPGGNSSCVTGTTGSCTVSSADISLNTGFTVMAVTSVSGANLTYDASQNFASQLSIAKP